MICPTGSVATRSRLGRYALHHPIPRAPQRRLLARKMALLVCLFAAGGLVNASAADRYAVVPVSELKVMTVEELLDQEVVSVSRRNEPLGRAASSVFVIRGESANRVAATHLPELLRLAPQLFVGRASSTDWGVSARGFMRANSTVNKFLVLVDGRTVYSPFFSNVFWDVQDVFLPDLDRIEVIAGPAGVTWGSNAVNGVINVLTRRAHETLGTAIVAGAGTEEIAHFGVRHGTRFGRDGAVRVWAKRRQTASTLGPGGVDDEFDESVFSQAGFRADWGEQWTVQGDVYRLRSDAGAAPPERAEGGNLLTRWTRDLDADSNLMVRLYYDYAMRDIQQGYVARTRTTDLEFQHRLRIGDNQQVLWGGHYRLMNDHVSQTTEEFAILPAELDFDLAGIFGQHDVQFADGTFQLTSGLRVENNEFSGWEAQPNLRFAWRPARWSTFWVAASRTTRTPSRIETGFYAPRDPPHFVQGGPDFRSEELIAGEIGARWQTRHGISITTTAFQHEYDDLRSIALGPPIVQANGVAGRSRGIEAFVDWDATTWWRIRAGGFAVDQDTWVKSGMIDLEGGLGESSFPRFQVQLRNTWWITDALTLWVALRHVDDVPALGDGGLSRVPAYTEMDASLTWTVHPNLELSIMGRNLLDASHPELGTTSNWREIERSVQAVLRCRF